MLAISNLAALYEARRLKDKHFIIISNNCWGSALYRSVGRPYNMPFVGLFIKPDSYLRVLKDLEGNLRNKLDFLDDDSHEYDYPLGILSGDIRIHFMHYPSKQAAREKWDRRVRRFFEDRENGAPLFVKMCDCDGCTREQLECFLKLPFEHKLALGIGKFEADDYLYVPRLRCGGKIFNGQKLFDFRYRYFDITEWILNGKIRKTLFSRLLSALSSPELWVYKLVCWGRKIATTESSQ